MNPLLIINFLKSRVGLFLIGSVLVSIGLFTMYHYIYNKGFNDAKNEDRNQYNEQLTIALNKQKQLFDKEVEKAKAVQSSEEKIKIEYRDRIKTVDKIVEKTIYKECVMPEQDFNQIKKTLESIK